MILSIYIMGHDLFSGVLEKLGMEITGKMGLFGMANAAAVGLAAGIGAIGYYSIKTAGDFDQAMHKISALTDTNSQQMAYYNQQILALGPSLDMSATDMAKSLYFVISAGLDPLGSAMDRAKINMDVLRYSAMAATAGMADQSQIADALTSALNAFGGSAKDVGHFMDDLTTAVTNGKMEWHDLTASFGFTATTAHVARLSIDEVAAAVSALTQVSGHSGARRMQMELDNLMRSLMNVSGLEKRAKQLGISFDAAKFSSMDFIEKLKYLQHITGALSSNINDQTYDQMKNMDATQNQLAATQKLNAELDKNNSNFQKLTGGAAAFIPAAVLLRDNAASYSDILAQMGTNGQKTVDAFDKMRDSTNQKWKMFELTVQNLAIVIGLQLLPAVGNLWTMLRNLGLMILNFLQNTQGMDQFKTALLGIALVAGAILTPALWGMIAPLLPFLAVLTAVIAAGIWLSNVLKQHPEILKALQRLWGDLTKLFGHASQAMGGPSGSGGTAKAAQHNVDALKQLGNVLATVLVAIINFLDYIVTHQWILDALKVILIGIAFVMAVNWVTGMGAALVSTISFVAEIPALIAGTEGATVAFAGMDLALGPVILAVLAVTAAVFGLSYAFDQVTKAMAPLSNYHPSKDWVHGDGVTPAPTPIDQMSLKQAQRDLQYNQKYINDVHNLQQRAKHARTKKEKEFLQAWATFGAASLPQHQQNLAADKARIKQLKDMNTETLNEANELRLRAKMAHAERLRYAREQAALLRQVGQRATPHGQSQAQEQRQHALHHTGQAAAARLAEQIAKQHQARMLMGQKAAYQMEEAAARQHHLALAVIAAVAHRAREVDKTQHHAKSLAIAKAAHATALAEARAHYAALHGLAQWFYNLMHPTHAKNHAKRLGDLKTHHKQVETAAQAHQALLLARLRAHGQQTVTQHAQQLQQGAKTTDAAAKAGITTPVQNQMTALHASLKDSGKNIVQMIADDITASAPKLGVAAQGAFNEIKGWLGFHSPAPNAPESAYWGRNLITMVAADLLQAGPLLAHAAHTALVGVAAQFTQAPALPGAVGGLAGAAPLVGGGSQTVNITHNWNGAFPGVSSSDEIVAAIRKVQEQDARLGRRPGPGGTRAPTGVL